MSEVSRKEDLIKIPRGKVMWMLVHNDKPKEQKFFFHMYDSSKERVFVISDEGKMYCHSFKDFQVQFFGWGYRLKDGDKTSLEFRLTK